MKHQAIEAPFHIETIWEDDRLLNDDLPILIVDTTTDSESEDAILSTEQPLDY